MRNISEQLFEQLCESRGIQWERIPEDENKRTPDYLIRLSSTPVVVEVKQIEMKKNNYRRLQALEKERIVWFKGTGHIRIRNIIRSANTQVRNFSRGLYPSILAIFDNTQGLAHLDHEDVLNGMYGDEAVDVIWPTQSESGADVQIVGHRFGGNRRMTPRSNRSTSAVGLLEIRNDAREPGLTLFHNIHAAPRLSYGLAWEIAQKQYTIEEGTYNYQTWREIAR